MFRENTEKYITFSVPKEKGVTKIDKNREEITKIIPHKLQFIDSARFMASSLPNLINNLPEGIHKVKWKIRRDEKNAKLAEPNINIATVFFNTKALKII